MSCVSSMKKRMEQKSNQTRIHGLFYTSTFECVCVLVSMCTSVCMFGTDPVLPLAIAELELLGLLGPEPGALLQSEETG